MKKSVVLILLAIFTHPMMLSAQANPEEIASVNDKFQESFYESLKQKAIENYDKAVDALEKCQKLQPENATVLYELGKNYIFLRDYKKAYESFDKASKIDTKNRWYLDGKYEACYRLDNFQESIAIVQKLIDFDKIYKEDLVTLYVKTQQFEKALELINELNETVGKTEKRELYKSQILRDSKLQGTEITNLLELIQKKPKEESNYIALIDLYNENGQEDKAMEVAKKLEKEIPTSDWAQVNLFRSYLKAGKNDLAIQSLNKALASYKIGRMVKHKMLNEFLIFVKNNPQYNNDLEHAIGYFKDDKEVKVAKEIGKFFQSKKDWDKAINYYELDRKNNSNDIETLLLLLECYTEKQQFDVVFKNSETALELFPMQPEFYYYSGLADNQLKNYKKAKKILEQGLDYLVDNKELEINFYIQLGEAFNGLGDTKMKENYFQKADQLLKHK